MKRRTVVAMLGAFALSLGSVGFVPNATAEVSEVKVALQYGVGYLPLAVMRQNKLFEKHLLQEGLKNTTVTWARLANGSAMNDALLSGDLNFAAGGVAPFLTMWDKTRGHGDVKAIAALCSMPMFINTNDPRIKSVKDFTSSDRIAVAGAGSSIETIVLWMEAAKLYGQDDYRHFDAMMVSLPHPAGMAALLSKKDISAQFTSPPFQYMELEHPDIHTALNSYDVTGPATFLVTWTTSTFRTENPKVYKAFFAAQKEATELINKNKRAAAEIYIKDSNSKESVDFIAKILNDPEIKITLTPQAVKKTADFMHQVGRLKVDPASWKDLFFPEVHKLHGS